MPMPLTTQGVAVAITVMLSLAGCAESKGERTSVSSSSGNGKNSKSTKETTQQGSATETTQQGSATETTGGSEPALSGIWETECIASDEEGSVLRIEFTGADFTATNMEYTGTDCAELARSYEGGGSFVAGAEHGSGNKLDLTTKNISLTIHTAAGVDSANQKSLCGANDWVLNQKKEFALGSCDLIGTGGTIYDIYKVSAEALVFGAKDDTNNKKSEASRPLQLNFDTVYKSVK